MWELNSFKNFEILQQGCYNDAHRYHHEIDKISQLEPIVSVKSIENLRGTMNEVASGKKFILQIGDCAELYSEMTKANTKKKLAFYGLVSSLLASAIEKEVVTIGRIAGQFAKPRSSPYETCNGSFSYNNSVKTYSYKGDLINDRCQDNREADPMRLQKGYENAKNTLNDITHFLNQGSTELETEFSEMKEDLLENIKNLEVKSLLSNEFIHPQKNIYISHEGLHLDYEAALTRKSNGKFYTQTADMLWIGNRTRNLPGAHIEFFRNVSNVIGVKVDDNLEGEEFISLVKTLNPLNERNKLIIITRFGNGNGIKKLQELIHLKQSLGLNFLWMIDPMHGNTFTSTENLKTRDFNTILNEVVTIATTFRDNGETLSGVHLEATADNVTEVIGGEANPIEASDLPINYKSGCDPRLNRLQTVELMASISKYLRL